jgi:predicted metal-dependent HD superfamily phosphohydrolase
MFGHTVTVPSKSQILAIWYHDAIYTPGSKTNEGESATLFFNHNEGKVDGTTFAQTFTIISDTQDHIPSIEESKLVIDLDLMGLANPWKDYHRDAANIRAEFNIFTDEQWKEGRVKWIDSMLARKQIFYTEWGRHLELKARLNLEDERRMLVYPIHG